MSRNPQNNPTVRIGRLIEEMDELLFCLDAWQNAGMALPIEVINDLPAKPRLPNLEAERTRRSLTYSRSTSANNARKARQAAMEIE